MNEERLEFPHTRIIETDGKGPIEGNDIVEFRLLYQGLLTANGSVADKFMIRRQFHPQLRRLCLEHHELRSQILMYGHAEAWEKYGDSCTEAQSLEIGIMRLADTNLNGFRFMALSRNEWHLRCSIDALFLRRESPGRVFMKNGDIDNRLKTLFDALRMPHTGAEVGSESPDSNENPFYVLLEDDESIANISVTTDRLLQFPLEHQYDSEYVVLVLNVRLQPIRRSGWMHVFNGL